MNKPKKYNNIKEFLETCSEDEQNYIYDLYFDLSVDELIDMLFEYMPAEDTIAEIEDYRRELLEEEAEDIAKEIKDFERKLAQEEADKK